MISGRTVAKVIPFVIGRQEVNSSAPHRAGRPIVPSMDLDHVPIPGSGERQPGQPRMS